MRSFRQGTTATGLLFVIYGAGQWVNGHGWAKWVLLAGFVLWGITLFRWFRQAISESEGGLYGDRIDISFRWSMSWFIFSEVMFFGAFFGALYWTRLHALPSLGDLENAVLWPDFKAVWPSARPGAVSVISATATMSTRGSLAKISMSAVPPRPAPMIATCVPLDAPVLGACLRDLDWIVGIVTPTR